MDVKVKDVMKWGNSLNKLKGFSPYQLFKEDPFRYHVGAKSQEKVNEIIHNYKQLKSILDNLFIELQTLPLIIISSLDNKPKMAIEINDYLSLTKFEATVKGTIHFFNKNLDKPPDNICKSDLTSLTNKIIYTNIDLDFLLVLSRNNRLSFI